MIYKFKKWVYIPCFTDIYINADSDPEAVSTVSKLQLDSFNWQECPMTHIRTTYEIVKENGKKS